MKGHCFAAAVLLVGLASSLPAGDDLGEAKPASTAQAADAAEGKPRFGEPIDYLDFVFLASDRPVLLRLHLRNNGQPYRAPWDAYLQKLYAYLDTNGDGVLDKAETERAPSIQFLQFHFQGAIGFNYQGSKGQMGQFDTNKDGKVSLAEFKEFYRRGGLAPVQFFSSNNRATADAVTNTFYKRLDSNQDGKLSAQEMAQAETALLRFDLDEDEMLTAEELMPGGENNSPFGRPFNGGQASPNADIGFLEIKSEKVNNLSRQVLVHYDKNKNGKLSQKEIGLDKPLFDKLDANHDGQLDAKEFTAFFRRDADLELLVGAGSISQGAPIAGLLWKLGVSSLGAVRVAVFNPHQRSMPLAAKVKRRGPSTVAFTWGDAHIAVSASDQQFGNFSRQFFEQRFREADVGKKGVVDRKQAMSARFLGEIFDLVDRNSDGKMTQQELKAYLDMQSEGAGCRIPLTFTDEGRSLFEVLDKDGDGRLSLRELRTAWARMQPLVGREDGLTQQAIPRRLDVSASQNPRRIRVVPGQSRRVNFAGKSRSVPLWFQKMDRNQDGDISPREFLGRDEDFRKLDTDGDGLISTAEAQQFEEKTKKSKAQTADAAKR
jgi:Ca2+-binding EF-hand superfamily protein